ncbi:MAG: hypothetical protein ABI629_05045 [bacterium]
MGVAVRVLVAVKVLVGVAVRVGVDTVLVAVDVFMFHGAAKALPAVARLDAISTANNSAGVLLIFPSCSCTAKTGAPEVETRSCFTGHAAKGAMTGALLCEVRNARADVRVPVTRDPYPARPAVRNN